MSNIIESVVLIAPITSFRSVLNSSTEILILNDGPSIAIAPGSLAEIL
jgi:hypothetical protein